jgi:hypothetical protein
MNNDLDNPYSLLNFYGKDVFDGSYINMQNISIIGTNL